MKKLCFVTTTSATFKAFIIPIAEELHRFHPEYEITFVCDNDEEFVKELPDYITYHPVAMHRGVSLSGVTSVFAMYRFFRKAGFDLVQYATPNASLYAGLASKLAGVSCRLYCQWGIRYVGFSGMSRKIFKFFEKLACSCATHINAVSPKNMQFAIDEKLYKPKKSVVVGNGGTVGVDLAQYDVSKKSEWRRQLRTELNLSDSTTVFGFVGRLSLDKGMVELLLAVKEVSQVSDIALICVGNSELEPNPQYNHLLEWANQSSAVVFTGHKEKQEVCKYYTAMDVYVHPTYREGFGLVLQEAAAMACPVITTRIPGAGEVLPEGEACLLAEAKSTESLINCMQEFLENPTLAATMGQTARKVVEERYERSVMLLYQMQRYQDLLGE